MGSWQILEGDALELLAGIDSESIDAIVTDPPYGLGFMGKEWDSPGGCGDFPMRRSDPINTVNTGVSRQGGRQRSCEDFAKRQARDARSAQEWHFAWATLALRVLKPGAHLVAFGGTRTYHRLACALEDAGFEIRDSLMWIYGSGFPKSLDVSKAIDRAAGAERQAVGKHPDPRHNYPNTDITGGHYIGGKPASRESGIVTAPATDAARQWQGWGTALKPAHEPIVLARKPPEGTVAANVQEYGTGALNVDGCRIETADGRAAWSYPAGAGGHAFKFKDDPNKHGPKEAPSSGRWPPNVLLTHSANCGKECADDCPAAQLDRQSGDTGQQGALTGREPRSDSMSGSVYGQGKVGQAFSIHDDPAGASRFFPRFRYEAKASTAERNAGLDGCAQVLYAPSLWVKEVLSRATGNQEASRLKATVGSTIRTSDGCVWSTCWCGSPSTDLSRRLIRSIIETATASTTELRTWRSSARAHTNGCMAAAFGAMVSGGSLVSSAERASRLEKLTGISPERDGLSMDDADRATSLESWLTSEPERGGGHRVGSPNSHPT